MRIGATISWTGLIIFALVLSSGCAANRGKQTLDSGYKALEEHQYDQAIKQADTFLRQTPQGPGSAEALYLRGRAYEQKVASSREEARANLQAARLAYVQALELSPPPPVETHVRTSLANVAYYQDDFVTAIEQWTVAYDRLDQADLKARILYRIGLSQQRIGRFPEADRTFSAVQREYAGTQAAQWARQAQGARAFYVQLATYKSDTNAASAVAALRQVGVAPVRSTDALGRQVIRLGPYATYRQARDMQVRFSTQYPDAMILP